MNDLYFTHIKIAPIYRNTIVCRNWYNNTKVSLWDKKIEFYDLQLFNLINSKCACYIRYKYVYDKEGLIDRENIDDGNNKLFINSYDNLINALMNNIVVDLKFKKDMCDKMKDSYNKTKELYNSYMTHLYNFTDRDIAEEYKRLLVKYYDYDISIFPDSPLSLCDK